MEHLMQLGMQRGENQEGSSAAAMALLELAEPLTQCVKPLAKHLQATYRHPAGRPRDIMPASARPRAKATNHLRKVRAHLRYGIPARKAQSERFP